MKSFALAFLNRYYSLPENHMFRSMFCTCKNRKYQGDPHEAACILSLGQQYRNYEIQIVPVERKCTCGNADDKTCKTSAHSSWCDGIKP
jgi:hypothetical protein